MSLTLALVTDTHVRVPYDDGQRAFPSDAAHNDRNRTAAALIQRMAPDAIVHLGDVVHPIPTLPTHTEALAIAAEIYGNLGAPLFVVPGNHDVGDKRTTANAPAQVAEGRAAFRRTWGPPFRSFDLGGVHFAIVDGTLLSAHGAEADTQRHWLDGDLAAHDRSFVFTHYPPFLCDPAEPEHYDNLGPDARRWLLDILARHGVEALFTGHVHRFFYNRYAGVDLYTLPSAAFVRPEYAALRATPPGDAEHGRDDREHIGITRLTIEDTGHRLEVMRFLSEAAPAVPPRPAPTRRLGTWLRHRLGRMSELPYGDLDALIRKVARDDMVMLHLLELGLGWIRIPLLDLRDPDVRDRVAWLGRQGIALSVFSAGVPSVEEHELYTEHAPEDGADWEVVLRPRDFAAMATRLAAVTGPGFTLGRIGKPWNAADGGYHSHFPREGFAADDPALDDLLQAAAPGAVARIAFRIADDAPVAPQVAAAQARAQSLGMGATCHVEVPFAAEAVRQVDDARVTARVVAAASAAEAHPDVRIAIDLLVDKDRGYWPRNGLVSVADVPRPAYRALRAHGVGPFVDDPG